MADPGAYTERQLRRAVNLAAVLGWGAVVSLALPFPIAFLPWAAGIGLPVAFLACWLVGAPILRRAMRRPVTWLGAARSGALIGAGIALAGIILQRILAWLVSRDPDFRSQVGRGEHVHSVDGVLTLKGWLVLGQAALGLIVVGALVALAVRWAIGPGVSKGSTLRRQGASVGQIGA